MTTTMKDALSGIVQALQEGSAPPLDPVVFTCFNEESLADQPEIDLTLIQALAANLSAADIPTFERALELLEAGVAAWVGFKFVIDGTVALSSRGGEGASADASPGVFVVTEDKEITFGRPYTKRDEKQMLDITRGPHMHNEQFPGVAWLSQPLLVPGRVFVFGAGEVPLWVERMAAAVAFKTTVIDDDELYLTEERFPLSERVHIDSFDAVPDLGISERDYVCVLTRGHVNDPEALVCALTTDAHYIGMMGCAVKNERVFAKVQEAGFTREQLEATHSPIGLKFGAKTPPELAMCIVAELIQDRYNRRTNHG